MPAYGLQLRYPAAALFPELKQLAAPSRPRHATTRPRRRGPRHQRTAQRAEDRRRARPAGGPPGDRVAAGPRRAVDSARAADARCRPRRPSCVRSSRRSPPQTLYPDAVHRALRDRFPDHPATTHRSRAHPPVACPSSSAVGFRRSTMPGLCPAPVERRRHCRTAPRPGQPLRGLAGAGPVHHRGPRGVQVAALTDTQGAEMVDGATVSVAVVYSRIEAELIAGLLRSHGVRAAVVADDAAARSRRTAAGRCPRAGRPLRRGHGPSAPRHRGRQRRTGWRPLGAGGRSAARSRAGHGRARYSCTRRMRSSPRPPLRPPA